MRCFARYGPAVFALLCLSVKIGYSQSSSQTPSDLIATLTKHDRSDALKILMGSVLTCGERADAGEKGRDIAKALANMGPRALPDLVNVIASLEDHGPEPGFENDSAWLLYAYANIAKRDAYPVFLRMMSNPLLRSLQNVIDNCMALVLGLTSYVDGFRVHATPICRAQEPAEALDNFIVDWLNDDRQSAEKDLGSESAAVLKLLTKKETWEDLRHRLWLSGNKGLVAVGYRLDATAWSEPEASLDYPPERIHALREGPLPEMNVSLRNRAGIACGTQAIRFVRLPANGIGVARYLIDSSNLEELLRLIASCAADSRAE